MAARNDVVGPHPALQPAESTLADPGVRPCRAARQPARRVERASRLSEPSSGAKRRSIDVQVAAGACVQRNHAPCRSAQLPHASGWRKRFDGRRTAASSASAVGRSNVPVAVAPRAFRRSGRRPNRQGRRCGGPRAASRTHAVSWLARRARSATASGKCPAPASTWWRGPRRTPCARRSREDGVAQVRSMPSTRCRGPTPSTTSWAGSARSALRPRSQVDTLLPTSRPPCRAGHFGNRRGGRRALQCSLVRALAAQVIHAVRQARCGPRPDSTWRNRCRSGSPPDARSVRARARQALRRTRASDFARVGRADGGDRARIGDPRL